MEEKTGYWESKILIGKGNLQQFSQDYERINAGTAQFATASQLFPVGQVPAGGEFAMCYEYVIYYKVSPNATKQLNPQTGQVEQKKKLVI
jgi:hypothetical protein